MRCFFNKVLLEICSCDCGAAVIVAFFNKGWKMSNRCGSTWRGHLIRVFLHLLIHKRKYWMWHLHVKCSFDSRKCGNIVERKLIIKYCTLVSPGVMCSTILTLCTKQKVGGIVPLYEWISDNYRTYRPPFPLTSKLCLFVTVPVQSKEYVFHTTYWKIQSTSCNEAQCRILSFCQGEHAHYWPLLAE